jgi:protein-glucosylgalactosylhydroxylysine glucosidase
MNSSNSSDNGLKKKFRFAQCLCKAEANDTAGENVAQHIRLLYDEANDYHPQFEGYTMGTTIKQADVILLNYPLQYKMKEYVKSFYC